MGNFQRLDDKTKLVVLVWHMYGDRYPKNMFNALRCLVENMDLFGVGYPTKNMLRFMIYHKAIFDHEGDMYVMKAPYRDMARTIYPQYRREIEKFIGDTSTKCGIVNSTNENLFDLIVLTVMAYFYLGLMFYWFIMVPTGKGPLEVITNVFLKTFSWIGHNANDPILILALILILLLLFLLFLTQKLASPFQ